MHSSFGTGLVLGACAMTVEAAAPVAEKKAVTAASEEQQTPLLLHMPVDVRSAALVMLTVLGVVYTLHWASRVFIPLMVGLFLTYALSPAVNHMTVRLRISRWIAAAVVLLVLLIASSFVVYRLYASAMALVDSLPTTALQFRQTLREGRQADPSSALDAVQRAASQVEQAAAEHAKTTVGSPGVTRVTVEKPVFNIRDYLWSGTLGLVAALGQLMLVVFLTFFALGSGDMFRRKMLRIVGPRLQSKKITLQVLNDISSHIERYLLTQILTSALVGVATALAFLAFGLEHAIVWGFIAALTNLIPYLGSVVVMAASGVAAFVQFGSMQTALMVASASLLIHTLVGNLLLPWLTSKSSRMNPVAVFIGVIFWGWLWGVWGLLLGMPIMMMIKAVCEHVEDLQDLGELLSG